MNMANIDFDLIIKYFSGKASPEEAASVEDFALSSSEKYAYFQSLYEQWILSGKENYQQPDVQKEWENFKSQHLPSSANRHPMRTLAIAASVSVLLGLGIYFTFFFSNNPPKIISLYATVQQTKLLSDSTQITLFKGTTLRFPKKFSDNERIVSLEGNADFDVHHNSQKPFIIHLPHDLNVQVTGTSFLVTQTPEEIRVDLHRGSVLFYNRKDTLSLAANQTGKYLLSKQQFILQLPVPTKGTFNFKNTPLSEVAAQLQGYFQSKIYFKNPAIAQCRLSADFKNQSLKEIIQIIAVTFNLDDTINEGTIYLDGQGCR